MAKTEGYAQYTASDDEPNPDLSSSEDGEDEDLDDLVATRPRNLWHSGRTSPNPGKPVSLGPIAAAINFVPPANESGSHKPVLAASADDARASTVVPSRAVLKPHSSHNSHLVSNIPARAVGVEEDSEDEEESEEESEEEEESEDEEDDQFGELCRNNEGRIQKKSKGCAFFLKFGVCKFYHSDAPAGTTGAIDGLNMKSFKKLSKLRAFKKDRRRRR